MCSCMCLVHGLCSAVGLAPAEDIKISAHISLHLDILMKFFI
jgi:hypothetical protein